jgi:hypothetical protein
MLIGCLTFLACSPPSTEAPKAAANDLIIKRQVTTPGGGASIDSTCYWGERLRVTDDPQRRVSFDLDTKTVTVLDKKSNAYFTLTFDQVLQQRQAQDQRFEGLPLEERKKVGLDKAIELTPSGKAETIAGRPAKEYTFGAAQLSGSVWIAEDLQAPSGWAEWNNVIANVESSGYAGRKLAESIGRIKGYPVRSTLNVTMGAQQTAFTVEVTEVLHGVIPPEMTKPPAGAIKAEAPIK